MGTQKATLSITDIVIATVRTGSNRFMRFTLSGYRTMNELMKGLCDRLGGVAGLVTVELRNSTLGWSEKRFLRLAAKPVAPVQLTLF